MHSIPISTVSGGKFANKSSYLDEIPPQHPSFCGPMEESCVAKALKADSGCQAKCTGLYADVWYWEDDKIPDRMDDRDNMLLHMLKDGKLFFIQTDLCLIIVNLVSKWFFV